VSHVTWLHSLPFRHFGCRFVLLGAGYVSAGERRSQLIPDVLLQDRGNIGLLGEIPFGSRKPAPLTHMNEVRKRLRSRGALMEIRALAAKGVGRHHRLRSETCVTDRTPKIDLL